MTEAIADRACAADGSLVHRTEPGAVLHDPMSSQTGLSGWSGRFCDRATLIWA